MGVPGEVKDMLSKDVKDHGEEVQPWKRRASEKWLMKWLVIVGNIMVIIIRVS